MYLSFYGISSTVDFLAFFREKEIVGVKKKDKEQNIL